MFFLSSTSRIYTYSCKGLVEDMPTGIYERKGHSQETRDKIAKGNTGQIFTKERCLAIAEANTSKLKEDDLEKILLFKKVLQENVCSFESCLRHVNLTYSNAVRRYCLENDIIVNSKMKFFNNAIDYDIGKLLLSYIKLGIHPREIQKRLNIKEKCFWGAAKKFQLVHNFEYKWTRIKPWDLGSKPSSIEIKIANILKEYSIDYEAEYSFEGFYYDFWIKDTSLFLEVQGDYWHANPLVYPDKTKINVIQKGNVKRDHIKRLTAKKYGFYAVYLWETDIKKNEDMIREIIKKYTRIAYEKAKNLEAV